MKPLSNCTIVPVNSPSSSDDSSLWYIITAVCIALVCAIAGVLFIRKAERPKKFADFSEARYRTKIIGAFYDFGTHIVAVVVIAHTAISMLLTPWQLISLTQDDYSIHEIYINKNTVKCPDSMSIEWQKNITIAGQDCFVSSLSPMRDGFSVVGMALAIIWGIGTAVMKLKYSLYSKKSYKGFMMQGLSYGIVLAAGAYTLAETDYCYGYKPAYMSNGPFDLSDGSSGVVLMSVVVYFCYFMYVVTRYIRIHGVLRNKSEWEKEDARQQFKKILTVTLVVIALIGLWWRIWTFIQGFHELLNPTLLTNDVLFYFHTALNMLPALNLAQDVAGLFRGVRKRGNRVRESQERLI